MIEEKKECVKSFLAELYRGAPIEKLKDIARHAELWFPELEGIELRKSCKYLYGNESWVMMFREHPFLRIAGEAGSYRIMTATAAEERPVASSFFSDLLKVSELLGYLMGVKLLRLEDHWGRKFNVLGEFSQSPTEISEDIRMLTWGFMVIGCNYEAFSAIDPLEERDWFVENSDIEVATKPWDTEKVREKAAEDTRAELCQLYQDLGGGGANDDIDDWGEDEDEDVYLMDGCWLTKTGEIVSR